MTDQNKHISDKIEDAKLKFNQYAQTQKDFQVPQAKIDIDTESNDTTKVYIEVPYNGTQYHFESIQEKDLDNIYRYLNSQPLVREKYSDGNVVSLEGTTTRVHTLVNRFRNKNSPLYLYSGFVVSDAETEMFLGIANLGNSSGNGISEMACMNRTECWSRPPDAITTYAIVDGHAPPRKAYSGVGTVESCTLLQYATRLKQENYRINGYPLTAVVATVRLDNEASWKCKAKAGMTLYAVDTVSYYGSSLRYQLRKDIV